MQIEFPDLVVNFQAKHFMGSPVSLYSGMQPDSGITSAATADFAINATPRLSKEQHDVLENEFQKQAKPNTNAKKRFAKMLEISLEKVNVRKRTLKKLFVSS